MLSEEGGGGVFAQRYGHLQPDLFDVYLLLAPLLFVIGLLVAIFAGLGRRRGGVGHLVSAIVIVACAVPSMLGGAAMIT